MVFEIILSTSLKFGDLKLLKQIHAAHLLSVEQVR